MKKTRKRSALLIALVVLLLATAIGYAAFSTNLQITGSASAKAIWDIHFENASIDDNTLGEVHITSGTNTSDSMDVTVNFKEPGQSAAVTVDVVNDGTFTARLDTITISAKDGSSQTITPDANGVYKATNGVIEMVLNAADTPFAADDTIPAEGSKTYEMTFAWIDQGDENPTTVDEKNTFTIDFNYVQNS